MSVNTVVQGVGGGGGEETNTQLGSAVKARGFGPESVSRISKVYSVCPGGAVIVSISSVQSSLFQDGIYALGKAHYHVPHSIFQKFPQRRL